MQALLSQLRRWTVTVALALALQGVRAQPVSSSDAAVSALATENRDLRGRVTSLEQQVEALRAQIQAWETERSDRPAEPLSRGAIAGAPRMDESAAERPRELESSMTRSASSGRVVLSGELGVVYFDGGAEGAFPAGQFRVDDTKLYLDAEIRRGVYAFVEMDVVLRENAEEFRLGEVYLELEDIGATVGLEGLVTLRAGRIDVPFGEEYLARGMMQNPLVSHSLADFWGVDEGVEIFGGRGKWTYVLAVQNGSRPAFGDFTSDKAVTLRVGLDPHPHLHLGASAMRTGDIDPDREFLTELWWGGGFIRSIGDPDTTRVFSAELYQFDAALRWRGGGLKAAAGAVHYDDDDPTRDNRRRMRHAMIEGRHALGPRLYAAGRYSVIDTGGGYPIAGHGNRGKYFFRPAPLLTDDVWRLSLGLGYLVAPDFLLKVEYSFEEGTLTGGGARTDMDRFSSQAAVRF